MCIWCQWWISDSELREFICDRVKERVREKEKGDCAVNATTDLTLGRPDHVSIIIWLNYLFIFFLFVYYI